MGAAEETAEAIEKATWPERIALVRKVPERFGTGQHADVYAAIASRAYASHLSPDFGYVHWMEEYELPAVAGAYQAARRETDGFRRVDVDSLASCLLKEPSALLAFRLILGFTAQEFAVLTEVIQPGDLAKIGVGRVKTMESGGTTTRRAAKACAEVISAAMSGALFPPVPGKLRSKFERPDLRDGWETVRGYDAGGVPLEVFLHQRHYGGAFRQLLDATSSRRGDVIEDAVEDLFREHGVPFVRTGSHNQDEIASRFGITVKPAPDVALYEGGDVLRAILECKGANDGGTARDKAARFRALHGEAARLGGIPLFAVLAGLGWRRIRDALGPVVRDTDGRVFMLPTLNEMMTVDPMPRLVGKVPPDLLLVAEPPASWPDPAEEDPATQK